MAEAFECTQRMMQQVAAFKTTVAGTQLCTALDSEAGAAVRARAAEASFAGLTDAFHSLVVSRRPPIGFKTPRPPPVVEETQGSEMQHGSQPETPQRP